jgi:aryl-alcohol dehydrogenase-like predicted oxidoreductase
MVWDLDTWFEWGIAEGHSETVSAVAIAERASAIQSEYSLMERSPEQNGVLRTCEELGIGFVAWGPVGMGYLTGKIGANANLDPKTDFRSGFERFTSENLAANRPVVELLMLLAEKKDATPSHIALAWLLAQKPWIVPIPGTRNIDHLTENLGAVNVQLTSADLIELETAFSKLTVHGGRMSEKYMTEVEQKD